MSARSTDLLLLFPPAMVDFLYPELGMPLLTGVARSRGIRTEQRDLNVELIHGSFASRENLSRIVDNTGWKSLLVGPGGEEGDGASGLLDLYRRIPAARRAMFLALSDILGLQPPSTQVEALMEWVGADHEQYDLFHRAVLGDLLESDPPPVAGISVCSSTQIGPSLKLATHLRRCGVSHVVIGGPWARAAAPMLSRWRRLFDHVDSIAVGDGENTLPDLVRAILDGVDPAGTPGLATVRRGELVSGPTPEPIPLPSSPEPDFSGLDLGRYENRWLPVRSRRTCPWGKCVFCHHVIDGEVPTERSLPAARTVDRMQELQKAHGVDVFEMANLSTPATEMEAIASEITRRGLDLKWLSLVRIEKGFDRRTLETLARSGCVELQFGLESISERDLDTINKGIHPDGVNDLLEASEGLGIRINLFVLNFPGQTRKDFERTLQFCCDNHALVNNFPLQRFTFSRSSPVFAQPSLLGLTIDSSADDDMDVFDVGYSADDELDIVEFMRMATDGTVKFRMLKTGSSPNFWEVQGIVDRLRGFKKRRTAAPRPQKLLLVRASLPGARKRGNEPPPIAPPLGVLYLASAVEHRSKYPHSVAVSDLGMDCLTPDEILGLLAGHNPDVVGISANNVDASMVHRVARFAKILDPGCTVVVGGPITTAIGEELFEDPFIDMLALHEGEETLPELLDTLAERGDPTTVAGLAFRGPDGKPRNTKRRAFIPDVDTIHMPDFDQIDLSSYGRLCNCNEFPIQTRVYAPIFTSRGCPWRCIFCHNHFGRKPRTRSADNVLDEMEMLVTRHGVGEIHIHDDIFNIDGDRLVAICDGIIERGLDIRFAFPNGVRADRLTRLHIEKLAAAGCYHMCMAFETVTPRLQKMIRKNLNVSRVLENVQIASENDIVTACFVMLGFPTETKAEIMATIDTVSESYFDYMRLFVACPHPNTALYDLAVENGFDPQTLPPRRFEYDWDRTMVNCTTLPDGEFKKLTHLAQEKFLTNPARLGRLRRIHEKYGIPFKGMHLSHGVMVDL